MSEGESVRGKDVYIVGGANSAGQAAMYFSAFAETVTMLVRRESLSTTMSQYLIDQIAATDNIRVWTKTNVQEAVGSERLEKLLIACDGGQTIETVDAPSHTPTGLATPSPATRTASYSRGRMR
jgi:thioredoxin reductase (NADPH)